MRLADRSLFYFAILTGLLILVAYYVGSTALGQTVGQQANTLALTVQGRTQSGQFAGYPKAA